MLMIVGGKCQADTSIQRSTDSVIVANISAKCCLTDSFPFIVCRTELNDVNSVIHRIILCSFITVADDASYKAR